jgi:hypothetical protein
MGTTYTLTNCLRRAVFSSAQRYRLWTGTPIIANRKFTITGDTRPRHRDGAGLSRSHTPTACVRLGKRPRGRNTDDVERSAPDIGQRRRFRRDADAMRLWKIMWEARKTHTGCRKFHHRTRAAERNRLRATGRVIRNGQRSSSGSDLSGFESHADLAIGARNERTPASGGPAKVS